MPDELPMDASAQKPKYEAPAIVDLSGPAKRASGDCTNGSSEITSCQEGASATWICGAGSAANECENGASAGLVCNEGSSH